MKKTHIVLAAGAFLFLLAGLALGLASYLLRDDEPPWTTRSKAALGAFEQGLEAIGREYRAEAAEHFGRALELDPQFVAAKLFLSSLYGAGAPPRAAELIDEVRAADLDRLRPRERFLVRYWLARHDGRQAEAEAILEAFLAEAPTDVFGLQALCDRHWLVQDWREADRCYRRLIELHPNRVQAHERLGFIAMAQGRFTEAEEHFLTYRYIAPDQARPHTALAELLILLGRYEEAEAALEEALAVKDDFCPAHRQLFRNYYFSDRFDEALDVLDRLARVPACAELAEHGYFCRGRALVAFFRGDVDEAWGHLEGECLERFHHGFDVVAYHIAIASGHLAEAEEMARRLEEIAEEMSLKGPAYRDWYAAARAHVRGIERMTAGDPGQAAVLLREADERLPYWTQELAGFKLMNRMFLVRSLERAGEPAAARAVMEELGSVNARFAAHVHDMRFMADE